MASRFAPKEFSDKDRSAAAIQVNIYTNLALGEPELGDPDGDPREAPVISGTYTVAAPLDGEGGEPAGAAADPEGPKGEGTPEMGPIEV